MSLAWTIVQMGAIYSRRDHCGPHLIGKAQRDRETCHAVREYCPCRRKPPQLRPFSDSVEEKLRRGYGAVEKEGEERSARHDKRSNKQDRDFVLLRMRRNPRVSVPFSPACGT